MSLLALSLCLSAASLAHAQVGGVGGGGPVLPGERTASPPPVTPPDAKQDTDGWNSFLTGDWGGLRSQLKHEGYEFNASYIGEYATLLGGGKRSGEDYTQQLAFGATFDLNKILGGNAGVLRLDFTQREGRNESSDYIGNKLAVQELYGAGNNLRVNDLSYRRSILNGAVDLKGGFYPLGDDFGTAPELCDFQNLGFCGHAQSLPNNAGWGDNPSSRWGGRGRVNGPFSTYAEIAVFDVNPTDSLHDNGLKFDFTGSTGAIFPFEVGQTLHLGPDHLTGHLKLGGYYDTSKAAVTSDPKAEHGGRYGVYLLYDQMIWRFKAGTERGLFLLINQTVSDTETAKMPTYFLTLVEARGFMASRPHDMIGLGYIHAQVNPRSLDLNQAPHDSAAYLPLQSAEKVIELNYGLEIKPWLYLHPNLQYIADPGAFAYKIIPNAWVGGLQIKLTL